MEKISVNIISPKFSKKGRRAEILMFISFGLLFLCYPINLLTGEGVLYMSIVALILLNMFFWSAYYYSVDKYVAIGQIIFERDQVTVKEETGFNIFKIADITDLTITYEGYEDETFLAFVRPYILRSTGHDNILSFQSGSMTFKYRFAILNKTVKTLLNLQLEGYKKLGADIRVEGKKMFVEF